MAKAAQQNRRTRKKSFILTLGLVLLIGYFVITFFSLRLSINERRSVREQKNAAYQQQLAENERLKSVVESDDKSEYIEQVAREKLGYVMPGEKVFYDVTPGA
ncbi:MAG: septum formation initiator family protein [Candidatus Fimenecus sp.]